MGKWELYIAHVPLPVPISRIDCGADVSRDLLAEKIPIRTWGLLLIGEWKRYSGCPLSRIRYRRCLQVSTRD